MTADAVKQSFERLLKIGQGPAEAFPKDLKVEAIDNTTVKFTLSQPFAPFLYTLANDGASIINPAILKEHAADDARGFLAQNTAGSGPFMLKSWQKGQQLVLVPNPHYAKSLAKAPPVACNCRVAISTLPMRFLLTSLLL